MLIRLIILFILCKLEFFIKSENNIFDFGWKLTKPINIIFNKYPYFLDILTIVNTISLLICHFIPFYNYIYFNSSILGDKMLILFFLRLITGYFTILPSSNELLESKYDVPPKGNNCIYFFSAHTFMHYMVILYLYENKLYKLFGLIVFCFGLQTIRLLGMRGHYSIDIIVACLLSHLIYYY
jgi:hypothetical protein